MADSVAYHTDDYRDKQLVPVVPTAYHSPLQVPYHWQNEVSGVLPKAIQAYFAHATKGAPLEDTDLQLVLSYVRYYLNAPCWASSQAPEYMAILADLRRAAAEAADDAQLQQLLMDCLEVGIDPL